MSLQGRVKPISVAAHTRLAVVGAGHRLRQARAAMARAAGLFGRRPPDRLIIAPQDLRTADPTIAAEFYGGQIKLAGKLLETHGRSPFELETPSEAFAIELHGFGWLRHLKAAETPLARANGRALVTDWLALRRRGELPSVARRSDVAARRLMSWLSHTPLLLDGADAGFYRQFVRETAREARDLDRRIGAEPQAERRLAMRIALMHYALAAAAGDRPIRQAASRLRAALDAQILPDGCHVSRNPQVLLETLVDLLPLKLAFMARRVQPPTGILAAIDRMIPMLRMLRHADGAMACFNGMGATPANLVAAVLALHDGVSPPPSRAPHGGYLRLQAGGAVLIVDAGPPPSPPLAHRAHAAPAAFEFSADGCRIVVNCGAPPESRPDLAGYARLTAAHSTLNVAEASAGQFRRSLLGGGDLGDQLIAGATEVVAQMAESDGGLSVVLRHDGYGRLRVLHERTLTLAGDGGTLAGVDRLKPTRSRMPDLLFALRFHLHPSIRASLSADAATAYIMTPSRAAWELTAGGLALSLEESAFFANPEGARRTVQIVVAGRSSTAQEIAWTLRRRVGAGAKS